MIPPLIQELAITAQKDNAVIPILCDALLEAEKPLAVKHLQDVHSHYKDCETLKSLAAGRWTYDRLWWTNDARKELEEWLGPNTIH